MIEFIVVPRPTFAPNACVCCMSIEGPMADTHRELPVNGHVYVCQGCAKRIARVFGFSKGKRMDELADAATLLARAHLEIERKDGEATVRDEQIAEQARRIETLEADNAVLAQRVDQLTEHIQAEAATLTAVVS